MLEYNEQTENLMEIAMMLEQLKPLKLSTWKCRRGVRVWQTEAMPG